MPVLCTLVLARARQARLPRPTLYLKSPPSAPAQVDLVTPVCCMQMLWHPSSTDSEGQNHRRPSNQSAVSAMSGMHLHVREWQLSTSELSFTFSADG